MISGPVRSKVRHGTHFWSSLTPRAEKVDSFCPLTLQLLFYPPCTQSHRDFLTSVVWNGRPGRGGRWCRVKRESCQTNASNTHLTGWKFRWQPSSRRQSAGGQHLNWSDSARREQIQPCPPRSAPCPLCELRPLLTWRSAAVDYEISYRVLSYVFHTSLLKDCMKLSGNKFSAVGFVCAQTSRTYSSARTDCSVILNAGCSAVASHHPRVSMEMIFISLNWFPLAFPVHLT